MSPLHAANVVLAHKQYKIPAQIAAAGSIQTSGVKRLACEGPSIFNATICDAGVRARVLQNDPAGERLIDGSIVPAAVLRARLGATQYSSRVATADLTLGAR